MKTFKQFLLEKPVSTININALENFLDKQFKSLNIDIVFTKHFKDRLNDPRNDKEIEDKELIDIFVKAKNKYGKLLLQKGGSEFEAVLNDISSKLNIPFILKFDKINKEIDLVSKTIMRKNDFKTPNQKLKV